MAAATAWSGSTTSSMPTSSMILLAVWLLAGLRFLASIRATRFSTPASRAARQARMLTESDLVTAMSIEALRNPACSSTSGCDPLPCTTSTLC